jgi:glycosyltransferase Alg8
MAPKAPQLAAVLPRSLSTTRSGVGRVNAPPPPRFRCGASRGVQWMVAASLLASAIALGAYLLLSDSRFAPELILAFSLVGLWRWGWAGLHYSRAIIYRYGFYPRLRAQALCAQRERGGVREVVIVATTYKEDPWITQRVFASLFSELSTLKRQRTPPRAVVITGGADDDLAVQDAYNECLERLICDGHEGHLPQLVLLRGENGKRLAIARGLGELAQWDLGLDSVVLLMDGDTELQPGLLDKILPLFRLRNGPAAVTTDENAFTDGPAWFAEWISLRLGQRHVSMCSLALSCRLLCLTGRLSAFRGDVAADPEFRRQIEDDRLEHWLYGQFEMLSGDDKSSWFYLVARSHRILYVPDALATTYEVVGDTGGRRAIANMNRWSGNMLRNSWRAIRLGPIRLGLFPWLCLVDQRIAMWTCLIGPTAALIALAAGRIDCVVGYLLWVLCSRSLRVVAACWHGRRLSACYVPAQVLSEWVGSLIKLWVSFHPVNQQWFNRGRRRLDSSRQGSHRALRRALAHYLLAASCTTFALAIGVYLDLIPLWREWPLAWRGRSSTVRHIEQTPTTTANHRKFFGAE